MRWKPGFCISAASADHRAMGEEEGLYQLYIHLATGHSLQLHTEAGLEASLCTWLSDGGGCLTGS